MTIASHLEESTLFIELPTTLDSANATEVGSEIDVILKTNKHAGLVLDAFHTEYVSSAGLRLVLRLQQSHKTFAIVNVGNEVYDVLEITGFTKIMRVKRAHREISIEGKPLIGQGAYGRVYRLNPDTIIKSYFRGNPIEDIERERNLAREAFILGIPTAISFDIVKVKEEHYGAVYELIDSDSLFSAFQKHHEKYEEYLDLYVDLLRKLSNTSTDNPKIPSAKDDLNRRLYLCRDVTGKKLFKDLKARLRTIKDEDRLIHGDCHFKNIFLGKDGIILIDMDTLSHGDPILELANLYRTYIAFEEVDPGNIKKFMDADPDFARKLYFDVFDRLCEKKPNKELYQEKVRFLAFFLLLSHYAEKKEKYADKIAKVIPILEESLAKITSF